MYHCCFFIHEDFKDKKHVFRRIIMETRDVMNLPWKKVTDWSELSASNEGRWGDYFVCATDVDVFVQNIYRDFARKTNIPFNELKPILEAENSAFYSLKEKLFKAYTGYSRTHARLRELENTLRIPDISNIKETVREDDVSKCLKLFNGLSDIEKTMFLQKIGKINIKVERCAVDVDTEETSIN